ncbi:MAG: HPr family phosphocarrier protein [Lachnospiraceae bacterium]|nr:HPr family phosphocarrier protein [Ruminococcus sp.]MCM1274806.1 HPr family phosphocarrier protein [Lachnospiraceae bacterium]
MKESKVMLNSIDDVKEFVAQVNRCVFDVDLLSGRYAVDAKSIMGIFSLDLTKALTLIIHDDSKKADDFLDEIKRFIAE